MVRMGRGYYPWHYFWRYVCNGGLMDYPSIKNYLCYKVGDHLFVPHYTQPGLYVGHSIKKPCPQPNTFSYYFKSYYKRELLNMGAKEVMEHLWETSARNENEL